MAKTAQGNTESGRNSISGFLDHLAGTDASPDTAAEYRKDLAAFSR